LITRRTMLSPTWSMIFERRRADARAESVQIASFQRTGGIMMFDLAWNASRLLYQAPSAGEGCA
jgi:hypothetical protein